MLNSLSRLLTISYKSFWNICLVSHGMNFHPKEKDSTLAWDTALETIWSNIIECERWHEGPERFSDQPRTTQVIKQKGVELPK